MSLGRRMWLGGLTGVVLALALGHAGAMETGRPLLIVAVVTIDQIPVTETGIVVGPTRSGEWTEMIGDDPLSQYAFGLTFRQTAGALDILPHVVDPDGRVHAQGAIRLPREWQGPRDYDLPLTDVALPAGQWDGTGPRAALRLTVRRAD